MDLFRKSLLPFPGLPKPTQLPLRRHHDLRICIPGLKGTLMLQVHFYGVAAKLFSPN
jgi:hypothetical protein